MVEIELKSNELKEYLYLKLNKDRRIPIYYEDVENIKELTLNGLDFLDEPTDVTICDLVLFKNLESCTLINIHLKEEEIEVLNNLEAIKFMQFTNCIFPTNKKIKLKVKSLVFDKCNDINIKNFNEVPNIKQLRIVNCENVKLEGIEGFYNLTHLYLQNLEFDNIDILHKLKSIELLNLNGTKIEYMINLNSKIKLVHEDINYIYDVKN